MTIEFLVNHLWQSSCFALLAALLALVLRKNSPKVRYWIWLSASVKFLVPLALLVSLGGVIPRPASRAVAVPAAGFPNALVQIAEPFPPGSYSTTPARAPAHWVPVAIGVWALGFVAITFVRCRGWFRIRALLRAGAPVELPIPIPALIAPGAVEPGIVGFLRPVLVLPAGLLEHLNPRQLDAVLAHELCHVRRRDNFFAAVHMVVEAIFWFHPLVWWIGSRMVEERELACDEHVLRLGCEPTDYVEGILTVCRLYTESPLPCVSGVTGADVKKRLRAILAGSIARELSVGRKAILAVAGLATLAAPIVIGVLNAPAVRAQSSIAATAKFEVASIKLNKLGRDGTDGFKISHGKFNVSNVSLHMLITGAFHLQRPRVTGGPAWLTTDRFDISAKGDPSASDTQVLQMIQSLLVDRFGLVVHRETKDLPIYALVVSTKTGASKLHRPKDGVCDTPAPESGMHALDGGKIDFMQAISCGDLAAVGGPQGGFLWGKSISIASIADALSGLTDRPVVDRTGISGQFQFELRWSDGSQPVRRNEDEGPREKDPNSEAPPSIYVALQEQLGLKLEAAKGPVEVLVVDHAEKPSEN